MDNSLFGTSKSISTSCLIPNPLHSLQQPKGELKENNLGSNLGTVKPHSSQALCSLNNLSSLLIKARTKPLLHSLANSQASKILLLESSFKTILSITISIECLIFLSNIVSNSSRVTIFPSTLILLNPFFLIFSITSF